MRMGVLSVMFLFTFLAWGKEEFRIEYLPLSHLDLYWLGTHRTTLARGEEIIGQYLERCEQNGETYLIDGGVFGEEYVRRNPEQRELIARLMSAGRLEISAAWVDRWETLVTGESLIRNIVEGQRWLQSQLGVTSRVAAHPDLPSMTPQIAQLYRQAGVDFYVTSRKIFRDGQVWRYRAPDGTPLVVCTLAGGHYAFFPLRMEDVPPGSTFLPWLRCSPPPSVEALRRGFPAGRALMSGGAADLACRETFRERYGRHLEEYVALNRTNAPALGFGYSGAAEVLAPYLERHDIPERRDAIPSVWGVACDEEARWFSRDRELEAALLGAETLAVAADHLGVAWLPETAAWQGTFHEDAFFLRKDPIPRDGALRELWRMRLFSQDHNGGGCEGSQSTFFKRRLQERTLEYCRQIREKTLDSIARRLGGEGPALLLFNPLGQPHSEPVRADLPAGWLDGHELADGRGLPVPVQSLLRADGSVETWVSPDPVPSVGWLALRRRPGGTAADATRVKVEHQGDRLTLSGARVRVEIDLLKGRLTRLQELETGTDWGSPDVGRIWALAEHGSDVSLKIATNAATAEAIMTGFEVREQGPLFTRVTLKKRLLRSEIEQDVVVWADGARVDLETRLWWTGERRWQLRQELPKAETRAATSYGQAFWGSGWEQVAEGAGPWLPDELSVADFADYREVLGWLHLRRGKAGLALLTTHPGFHADASGLRAVLFRTSPSCGDPKLFWENAGEHTFRFSLRPCGAEWKTERLPQRAQVWERPVIARVVQSGKGDLPATHSLLGIGAEGVLLSALYPAQQKGAALMRVWESAGEKRDVTVSGPLAAAAATAEQVNLLENRESNLQKQKDAWKSEVPGWGLRTLRLTR